MVEYCLDVGDRRRAEAALRASEARYRTIVENVRDYAIFLLDAEGVALVPGEAFGTPGYARLSFALGDDDLREGVQRIADLVQG